MKKKGSQKNVIGLRTALELLLATLDGRGQ